MNVTVNRDRLWQWLKKIGGIGRDPAGGFSRFAWTPEYKEACLTLMEQMEKLGLQVRMDTVGNIYGRLEGRDSSLTPVLTGSHLDTVPNGGYFDGNAGIAAALECVAAMRDANIQPLRSLELVAFVNEEASQFLGGHFGSKAMCGMLAKDYALTCKHRSTGQTLYDAMKAFGMGLDPDNFAGSIIGKEDYHAFLELHVEQGKFLLDNNAEISVLTGIAGIKQFYITLHGVAAHAGGMAMKDRHDAMAAAAQIACKVERLALNGGESSRGTVGYIQAYPGEHNIVADKAVVPVDFREVDEAIWENLYTDLMDFVEMQCAQRGLTYEVHSTINTPPALCDERIVELLNGQAERLGVSNLPMISYPAHDAMNLARLFPMGMIFVRSSNEGRSHCPEEYTTPSDMEAATKVLLGGLLCLCGEELL